MTCTICTYQRRTSRTPLAPTETCRPCRQRARVLALRLTPGDCRDSISMISSFILHTFFALGVSEARRIMCSLRSRPANCSRSDAPGYWPYRFAPTGGPRAAPPAHDEIRPPKDPGNCPIPAAILDYALIPNEVDGPPPARPTYFPEIPACFYLKGVLTPCTVPPACPPTNVWPDRYNTPAPPDLSLVPVFTTFKRVEQWPPLYKPLQIWDARWANYHSRYRGRPFSLYNFDKVYQYILQAVMDGDDILMAKADWQNYYTSILLPPSCIHHTYQFTYNCDPALPMTASRTLMTTSRGIFGSAWMPAVGQALNVSLFQDSSMDACQCMAFQIIDDSLLCSRIVSGCNAHTHCDNMMHLGESTAGLKEATAKREMVQASQSSLVFAGKEVGLHGVTHPLQHWWTACCYLLTAFPDTLSMHQKRSFLGKLNWLICHQPMARPYILPLYPGKQLDTSVPFFRFNLFHCLAMAAVTRSTRHALLLHAPPAITTARSRDTIFVDASFTDGLVGIVIQYADGHTRGIRYEIPVKYSQDQQTAELWGTLKGFRLAALLKLHMFTIVGDNQGALYCIYDMKAPTRAWWRVNLLQQLSQLMLVHGEKFGYVPIKWLDGKFMPADVLSRNFVQVIGKFMDLPKVQQYVLRKIRELPKPKDINMSAPPHGIWK